MKSFKNHVLAEKSRYDLNPSFKGMSTDELMKRANDNRKYSPKQRAEFQHELKTRGQVREEAIPGAPGNNTNSGPGMGDDNTLRTRKARIFKNIYRRHGTKKDQTKIGVREDTDA